MLTLTLTACVKSEFGVSENTEKLITISATNADKDAFFISGSLEVEEGDEVFVTSDLSKGEIKIELVGMPEEQSIDEIPEFSGDADFTVEAAGTDEISETLTAGSYLLRVTCLKKATGTVTIEAKPAE